MLTSVPEHDITVGLKLINEATRIAVIPHRSPDGDAVGSALAMKFVLKNAGKSVDTVCVDPPPQNTKFLPETDQFINELKTDNYDLLIFVDCGASYMSKFHETNPEILDGSINTINIDHHESNDFFSTVNIVEPKAASTTQILFRLFQKWGFEINKQTATCLMTGLYFDTGSFRHNNTTPEVMKISGELLKLGADIKTISKYLFKKNSINKLKLWGSALSKIRKNHKEIVTSAVTQEDYENCQADTKDLEGVVDYLNAIPNSKFCILLAEDLKGGVKASMRTQSENVDLSKIAEVFGGGGHKMASGFRIDGEIKEEKHWTIQ